MVYTRNARIEWGDCDPANPKNRRSRSGDTSAAMFSGKKPRRALSIASRSKSVAKICRAKFPLGLACSTASLSFPSLRHLVTTCISSASGLRAQLRAVTNEFLRLAMPVTVK